MNEDMINKKSWEEFAASGLQWWINMVLHTFGWAIVFAFDTDGVLKDVYPARVKFRGYGPQITEEGYRKVSTYMAKHASELNEEAQA